MWPCNACCVQVLPARALVGECEAAQAPAPAINSCHPRACPARFRSVAAAYRVDDLGGIRWSMLMVQATPAPAEPVPMEVACLALNGDVACWFAGEGSASTSLLSSCLPQCAWFITWRHACNPVLQQPDGKTNEAGHLLWSGFARHIQPHLCPGALANAPCAVGPGSC